MDKNIATSSMVIDPALVEVRKINLQILAYGNHPQFATPFCGFGGFFFDVDERIKFSGVAYLHFFYQLGLCSMSTSISSGAIAERSNFKAAMLFSSFNILVQIIYFFDGRMADFHQDINRVP